MMVSLVATAIMTLLSGEGKSAQTAPMLFLIQQIAIYFSGFCGNKDGTQGLVHGRQALHHRAAPLLTTPALNSHEYSNTFPED